MNVQSAWTNTSEGILAFSCIAMDWEGNESPISDISCTCLKVNLALSILILLLYIYQMIVYYQNHRGKILKTRQRIMYLSVLNVASSAICYTIANIIAIYNIAFFIEQLLYLQLLGYLIFKIRKLSMGIFLKISRIIIYLLILALLVYLLFSLYPRQLSKNTKFCFGYLESEYLADKVIVLSAMIGLYIVGVIILIKLLKREHKALLDNATQQQREGELIKLKTVMIVIVLSEALQLLLSAYHIQYPDFTQNCSIIPLPTFPNLQVIITNIYRAVTILLPAVALLWLIWNRSGEGKRFTQKYEDEDPNKSHVAGNISLYNRSATRKKSSNSFLTNPLMHGHEDDDDL